MADIDKSYDAAVAVLKHTGVKNAKKRLSSILNIMANQINRNQIDDIKIFREWRLVRISKGSVSGMWKNFKILKKKFASNKESAKRKKTILTSLCGKENLSAALALLAHADNPAWRKKIAAKSTAKKKKAKRNKKPAAKKKPAKKNNIIVAKPQKTPAADPASISKGLMGNLGKTVVFQTNDKQILTFGGFSRTVKGRWASHARLGKKPLKQFLGPDAESITFTITLDAQHGVKPRTTAANIAKLVSSGAPQVLVIGGRKIGTYVVTESGEAWERVMNRGEAVRIVCSLTLEEYV